MRVTGAARRWSSPSFASRRVPPVQASRCSLSCAWLSLSSYSPRRRSVAASTAPTHAAAPELGIALERALAAADVPAARTAALAVDLRSGEVVFRANAGLALAPASAEKLAVSFAALRLLGPGYRFRTDVRGEGELVGKVWDGNLYLVGHGDPTLAPPDLDALARDVAAWGVRRVYGTRRSATRDTSTRAARRPAGSPGSSASSRRRSRRSRSRRSAAKG